MTTIVIPVKRGARNDELRWTLRSIEAHIPHDRLMLVGYKPPWVRHVEQVPVPQRYGDKHENVLANLKAALRVLKGEPFQWWNDDMYALHPVDQVPVLHRGLWRTFAKTYAERHPASKYTHIQNRTTTLMEKWGVPGRWKSYEVHAPMLYDDPALLADILQRAYEDGATMRDTRNRPARIFAWRSLYGNVARVGGTRITDPKVYNDTAPKDGQVWLSTVENHIGPALRQFLDRTFPEPSRYETGRRRASTTILHKR